MKWNATLIVVRAELSESTAIYYATSRHKNRECFCALSLYGCARRKGGSEHNQNSFCFTYGGRRGKRSTLLFPFVLPVMWFGLRRTKAGGKPQNWLFPPPSLDLTLIKKKCLCLRVRSKFERVLTSCKMLGNGFHLGKAVGQGDQTKNKKRWQKNHKTGLGRVIAPFYRKESRTTNPTCESETRVPVETRNKTLGSRD